MVHHGNANRILTFGCVGAVMVVGAFGLGCGSDPAVECTATYQHVLELARRNHDPVLMAKFVDACRESFDARRMACIRDAATAGEALACKPVRKRPG